MKISMIKTKNSDISIQLSELMYLCFLGLMLLAKGIGLYDGQLLYKIILILAFLCVGVKMCLTEHSWREWIIILIALLFSVVVYRNSGEKGILICMVTVLAMKNVSVKKIFTIGTIIWGIAFCGKFSIALLNIENVEMAIQNKNIFGPVLRYFMGFPHPNTLHISYFVLTLFVSYCLEKKYNLKHFCILMMGNIFMFLYSYSLTGTIIVAFYLLLFYYIKIRKVSKIEYFFVELTFPVCLIVAIILPVFAEGKLFAIADKIFNNRIAYSKHYLVWDNISLIGNNLAEITTKVLTMDNSLVFALIIYGVIVFGVICIVYFRIIHEYVREKKNIELAIIISSLIAGITEPFLFNTSFKNLTLFFIGEWMFLGLAKTEKRKKQWTLLKNKDVTFYVNINKGKGILGKHEKIKKIFANKINTFTIVSATVIMCMRMFLYQAPEYILQRARGNIMLMECIRVGITTFLVSYILISVFLYYIVYMKKEK